MIRPRDVTLAGVELIGMSLVTVAGDLSVSESGLEINTGVESPGSAISLEDTSGSASAVSLKSLRLRL